MRGEYIAVGSRLRRVGELPPRARRILFYLHGFMHNGGTTSACAENTCCGCGDRFGVRNYLRVRGEYPPNPKVTNSTLELPPRARRIRSNSQAQCNERGTTSACAENTTHPRARRQSTRNYLRVRGEYCLFVVEERLESELPPRARRILPAFTDSIPDNGTTSACAENTANSRPARSPAWNYLRVRGEYSRKKNIVFAWQELPPRARRIPPPQLDKPTPKGTTSACAENTRFFPQLAQQCGNYLRVRGEYTAVSAWRSRKMELPPRARRILMVDIKTVSARGTTSACAENTSLRFTNLLQKRNYLRVRGEYKPLIASRDSWLELPPRARRILQGLPIPVGDVGTTSACAENTSYQAIHWDYGGNYLRVRGEYRMRVVLLWIRVELPPRARRILGARIY